MEYRIETMKVLSAFFSVLVSISGLSLIGLGIYALAATHVTFSGQIWVSIFMIVMGAAVFLVSFLGCYGTMFEKRGVLLAYAIPLLLLVLIQLMLALYAVVHQVTVQVGLDVAWQNAYDRHPKLLRDIQDEYGCCGFKTVQDRAIPKTSPNACVESPVFGYNRPCFEVLQRGYQTELRVLVISEFVLIICQALALLCVTIMYKQLTRREEEVVAEERRPLLHSSDQPEEGTPVVRA
ncbi:hypothetical protein IWQ61_008429 [Dispira simplex]|nr:hypothetical protein IWQ61_008429 [Dispira simplex]